MDWMTLVQGGGMALVIFMLGANWMLLRRLEADIEEFKKVITPLATVQASVQATLTHQHEWLERIEREVHDLRVQRA